VSLSRVLVVDDEAEVCDLVARALTRAGYEVLTAETGEAAVLVLDAGPIDCLVVDKHLPGMHGGEVMAEARRRMPRLAVVLITGHPEPLSFGEARPDVTLPKPFKSRPWPRRWRPLARPRPSSRRSRSASPRWWRRSLRCAASESD
jgi:CheY-like chemotaxis protein